MAVLKYLNRKLPASSILEVLISMIVIMVVFGIALMIFANVARSSLSNRRLRAEALANETVISQERIANRQDQSFKTDDLLVEVGFKPVANNTGLEQMTVAIFDADHQIQLAQLQKLIRHDE